MSCFRNSSNNALQFFSGVCLKIFYKIFLRKSSTIFFPNVCTTTFQESSKIFFSSYPSMDRIFSKIIFIKIWPTLLQRFPHNYFQKFRKFSHFFLQSCQKIFHLIRKFLQSFLWKLVKHFLQEFLYGFFFSRNSLIHRSKRTSNMDCFKHSSKNLYTKSSKDFYRNSSRYLFKISSTHYVWNFSSISNSKFLRDSFRNYFKVLP